MKNVGLPRFGTTFLNPLRFNKGSMSTTKSAYYPQPGNPRINTLSPKLTPLSRPFPYDKASSALVDAIFMGDRAAAQKWEVSTRTVEEWRSRLHTDEKLQAEFKRKKRLRENAWATEIPETIKAGLKFIKDATSHCDPADPDAVKAIASSLKILLDVDLTKQVLDAKLAAMEEE